MDGWMDVVFELLMIALTPSAPMPLPKTLNPNPLHPKPLNPNPLNP